VISGIVLAAGASTRFGETKQLAILDGEPLVVHAIDALRTAAVDEILVILGHEEAAVRAVLPNDVTVIRNPAYRDGQATSLAAALHDVAEESDVRALTDGFRETRSQIVRLRYTDGPGPALLSREIYAEAGHLTGDAGARVLMASHPEWVYEVPIDRPAPRDVDTPDDLGAA
jgi:molybdenum cofactor cytidylyltransferase